MGLRGVVGGSTHSIGGTAESLAWTGEEVAFDYRDEQRALPFER